MPGRTAVTRGAAHDVIVPIHVEVGVGEAARGLVLPRRLRPGWTDQVDAVAFTSSGELSCADVGGIRQMLGGDQALGRQRGASTRMISCTVAAVVSAWTIRCGAPASQVSVRWTM